VCAGVAVAIGIAVAAGSVFVFAWELLVVVIEDDHVTGRLAPERRV